MQHRGHEAKRVAVHVLGRCSLVMSMQLTTHNTTPQANTPLPSTVQRLPTDPYLTPAHVMAVKVTHCTLCCKLVMILAEGKALRLSRVLICHKPANIQHDSTQFR